jgi:hypothetical protein
MASFAPAIAVAGPAGSGFIAPGEDRQLNAVEIEQAITDLGAAV